MKRKIIMLGAGGHARVMYAVLCTAGHSVEGCIAKEMPDNRWARQIAYLGGDDVLKKFIPADVVLVNGIGSVDSTRLRREIFESAKKLGFSFLTVVHPSSTIDDSVVLGEGAQVMAGAILQCQVELGLNVLVNTGVIVDHDCRVGSHTHLASGVCLSGSVTVGDEAHIGTGASVIQEISIGDRALVAAGAVVTEAVPADAVVGGIPAKSLIFDTRKSKA